MRNVSANRKIVIRGCTRCHGDLFFDRFEEDFFCLQCAKRVSASELFKSRLAVPAAA
ncbi:MAG TPA: hypothetical protein VNN21_09955 [Dehalococcoidia bacterium]|nr:hypothetical protein [Dehalococcoidia bacterium]